jgi:hypothetical protein
MSGVVSAVYGRRALDDAILDEIDAVLASASESVQGTRKGRVWDCWIGGRTIHVAVEETLNVLWDCEDDLLRLGLLPDDAPFRVVLTAACNAAEDRAVVTSLARQVSMSVNGVSTPPEP